VSAASGRGARRAVLIAAGASRPAAFWDLRPDA